MRLNERLLAERGIRSRERKDLEALHEVMDSMVFHWNGWSEREKGWSRDAFQNRVKRLEYLMQDAWGFPRNENKHTHRHRFEGLYPEPQSTHIGDGWYAGYMHGPRGGDVVVGPEKAIEDKVVKWANKEGWLALKFTPHGDVGWPDRIFVSPRGAHCWIEFKAPGKLPTPLQSKRIEQMRSNGAFVKWFNNAADAINWLGMFN